MLVVLSQFRWLRHWAVMLSRWLCLLPVLVLQLDRSGRKRTRDIVRKD